MYKLIETTVQEHKDASRRPGFSQRVSRLVHTVIARGLTWQEAKSRARGRKDISIVAEKHAKAGRLISCEASTVRQAQTVSGCNPHPANLSKVV